MKKIEEPCFGGTGQGSLKTKDKVICIHLQSLSQKLLTATAYLPRSTCGHDCS